MVYVHLHMKYTSQSIFDFPVITAGCLRLFSFVDQWRKSTSERAIEKTDVTLWFSNVFGKMQQQYERASLFKKFVKGVWGMRDASKGACNVHHVIGLLCCCNG